MFGANSTNAPTALSLAYNLCGEIDMNRMLSLNKGPLGQTGGIAAVLSIRLVGEDKVANIMLEVVNLVVALIETVKNPNSPAQTASPKGTGCAFAFFALLFAAGGGLVALVQHVS